MNREIKAKWLAALRSGKYQQGRGALRDMQNRYCCLGVLCDVLSAEWTPGDLGYCIDGEYGNLPITERFNVGVGNQEYTLVRMNDRGHTFSEIADYIETNL